MGYLGDKFHVNLIHTYKTDLKKVKNKKSKIKTIIMSSGDNIKLNGTLKTNIKNPYKSNHEDLIAFANEKGNQYKEYLIKIKKSKKPSLDNLTNQFLKKLLKNIDSSKKFNFKALISINEDNKIRTLFLNFNNKSIKLINKNYNNQKINLKINIESSKIRNLLKKKYPMNFLTFHNGGYTCERSTMKLTENENKYWNWINNLDFFI